MQGYQTLTVGLSKSSERHPGELRCWDTGRQKWRRRLPKCPWKYSTKGWQRTDHGGNCARAKPFMGCNREKSTRTSVDVFIEPVDIQNQSAFDRHAEFAITGLRQVLCPPWVSDRSGWVSRSSATEQCFK